MNGLGVTAVARNGNDGDAEPLQGEGGEVGGVAELAHDVSAHPGS